VIKSIIQIKEHIKSIYGQEVPCVINRGRNKLLKLKVKVEQVYPSMFIISPTDDIILERKSFSYNDVMCGDIRFL
jgi:uncharacterized protein Veg